VQALLLSISLREFVNYLTYLLLMSNILNLRMIPLWTIPMAAVTGNTLILKPSERDPGAAMMIAELCQRAGQEKSKACGAHFIHIISIRTRSASWCLERHPRRCAYGEWYMRPSCYQSHQFRRRGPRRKTYIRKVS